MHYGFNMAIHMSIGFLFLSSGKCTFSTSDMSIAALLMSLYPNFPDSSTDNKYHLQALRHFYVLAIQSKLLQTIDVESGELVSVPLEIEYKKLTNNNQFIDVAGDIRSVNTPIMLEDMHKINKIHLNSQKYYEVIIEKPEIVAHLQKGSHSVFARASGLLGTSEFTQKSISKVSILNPFDVNNDPQKAGGWIPKMIYVKKRIPIDCGDDEMNFSSKVYTLTPFEFSRKLTKMIELKNKNDSKVKVDSDAEGEDDEDEGAENTFINEASYKHNYDLATKLEHNGVSPAITRNPVIQKFLELICEYKGMLYSDLEPLILKGMSETEPGQDGDYSKSLDVEEYFEIMDETELLTDELEEKYTPGRVFSKNFYLGLLYECFHSNKIEVLPTYIKLFNCCMDYKNKNCLKNLTKEGKLISMFYKGLYEDHFVSTDEFEVEDDDDMDMSSQSRTIRRSSSMSEDVKSSNKLQQEPLIKKQFIEEVEEIMNQYTIDHNILQKTSEKFLDYRNSLSNPSELSKML